VEPLAVGPAPEEFVDPLAQEMRKTPEKQGVFLISCARGELNPHALSGTGT
jgi:hypothetical protein